MRRDIPFTVLEQAVHQAYEQCKGLDGGKNADYIPYLSGVDPNLFGIAVCLPDGRMVCEGDVDFRFGIESVSKVHTAILALRQLGPNIIVDKIGTDATGLSFDSIMALMLEMDHPSTPLVNAGAISTCSLIEPVGDIVAKWNAIVGNIEDLCGGPTELIYELYESESATNFKNRAIAWMLRDYKRIYDDPMMALDLYTRQCSLGVTAKQLAVSAATIADDGKNPLTGKQVFDPSLAPEIVSLIATVGFYQHSGHWLYTSGIPAKSGVGGAVMGVMPGAFGVCAFAPPLDGAGNSVKAQAAIKALVKMLDVNVFSNTRVAIVQ